MTHEAAFRGLRSAWFVRVLHQRPHEREWEGEGAEEFRVKLNRDLKAEFDAQTEEILRGEDRPVAPGCAADLSP